MANHTPQNPPNQGRPLPPEEHRFKPGVSGNPKGRPKSGGATLREWLNSLLADGTPEDDLQRIVRDKSEPPARRAAAVRVLRLCENPDMADYEGLMQGRETLADLRERGVNTAVIKKTKRRTVSVESVGGGTDGEQVEREFEHEIELHDRSGEEFDRVFDRTEGRPGTMKQHDDGETEAKTIRVRRITQSPKPIELPLPDAPQPG